MRLTPEARAQMLAEYQTGTDTVRVIAERYGVSPVTVAVQRRRAGVPGRGPSRRSQLVPVEVVAEMAQLLPVYPVRLVSRPHWTCACGGRIRDDFTFCPDCMRERPGYSTKGGT